MSLLSSLISPLNSGIYNRFVFSASQGLLTCSGPDLSGLTLSYKKNYVEVVVNGMLLPTTEYTATDGVSITFASALNAGDVVYVIALSTLSIADTYSKAQNGADILDKFAFKANLGILKKNYILNGAMMVSQENGTTAGTVSGYYPVDQFVVSWSTGTFTTQQVVSVTPAGSPTRVRITTTSGPSSVGASDFLCLTQPIEGLRVADLRSGTPQAKTVTLQFGCKGPAGTYSIGLRNQGTTRSCATSFTILPAEANTDVVKSVTFQLDQAGTWDNSINTGLQVLWTLYCGSTYQTPPNTWVAGNFVGATGTSSSMSINGNVFELFDVGLYEGTSAPPFQVPDYISELALCQRYFETGVQRIKYMSIPAGVAAAYDTIEFKVPKRTGGAAITVSGWQYYNAGAFAAFTPTINGVPTTHFEFLGTGLTNWQGWANSGTWKANARL